jgi:hypothetical protein
MTPILLILGGSLFALLGLLHALYTFADISRPRRLVPNDPAVMQAMSSSGVRLARGGTTMWRAWVGFNFSHSLGAILFGSACILVARSLPSLALPKPALLVPVAIAALYLCLAIRYWFRIPAIGIATASLCFLFAWLLY